MAVDTVPETYSGTVAFVSQYMIIGLAQRTSCNFMVRGNIGQISTFMTALEEQSSIAGVFLFGGKRGCVVYRNGGRK